MSAISLDAFDTLVQKTIHCLRTKMGERRTDKRRRAFNGLPALHSPRDRVGSENVVRLGVQLPRPNSVAFRLKCGTIFLVSALLPVASLPCRAQDTGDLQRGLSLAQQVCSECHAVDAQQLRSPNSRAPTFTELAATPGMTSTALTVALLTPHAGMPMFRLTDEQRAAVIAYILALGESGAQPGK